MNPIQINLTSSQFTEKETSLVESGALSASLFRFVSGVCAVRLQNGVGELVLLPFQGQQIWSAKMGGRDLTMRSMFDQPYPTREFLATFGAFMLHCGATAIGSPGPTDKHLLHGELPNAPYQTAQLVLGEEEGRPYIGLTGAYRHTLAFNANYLAQPLLKLYAGETVFNVAMTITNLKQTTMPLMYLAHIDFKPADRGRLVYSAIGDPAHMRVRDSVPDFMEVQPGYREFLHELKLHPEKHQRLDPGLAFDPEVVFYIDYLAGDNGWAHALQIHPDGSADVMRHRPDQLDHGICWICRTPDQDALGLEPATAEVEGFTAESQKGNVRSLPGGQSFHCDIQIGSLDSAKARAEEKAIAALIAHAA
jgi:hypothetical protein